MSNEMEISMLLRASLAAVLVFVGDSVTLANAPSA